MHRHQFDSHNPRLPLPQKHAQQVVLHDHEVQLLTLAQKQGVVEGLIDASECCSWEGFSEPFVTRFIAREAVSRVEALWAVQCWAKILSTIDRGSELTVALPDSLLDEARSSLVDEGRRLRRRFRRQVIRQGIAELVADPIAALFVGRALLFYVGLAILLGTTAVWLWTGSPVDLDPFMNKKNVFLLFGVCALLALIVLVVGTIRRMRERLANLKQWKMPQPGYFAPHIGDLPTHGEAGL